MYIRRFRSKIAFVAAGIAGYFALGFVMHALGVPPTVAITSRGITLVIAVFAGGRLSGLTAR